MKQLLKYTVLLVTASVLTLSCSDMNSLHQKYLDEGETYYMSVVDSLKAYPGVGRVQFAYELSADPRLDHTVIYWNNGADSTLVPVNRTASGRLTKEFMLRIAEGSYIFSLVNKDDEGHRSKNEDITVQVYGPQYAATLRNRNVQSQSLSGTTLTINWAGIESTAVQFVTVKCGSNRYRVENDDTKTIIENVQKGATFEVVTTYLPENSLDLIDAPTASYTVL